MANICIPKDVAKELKDAVGSGEISIQKLYDMSSTERRLTFRKYAGEELGRMINAKFEQAMVSKQKLALKKWVETVFSKSAKEKSNYKDILEKIEKLDNADAFKDDAFLEDLISEKLNITVSAEEVKEISDRAEKLGKLYEEQTEDGIPSVEYFIARKDMENYLDSLNPSSRMRVFTSIVGRGSMLFSVKSPITNIISNTVQGALQGFQRRLSSNTYRGLNGNFAMDYVKKVNKIFTKSGYDISRMESLADSQKRLGEEIPHSQGEGRVRKVGRFYEDLIFKKLMSAPDVAASSIAFADSVNLATTKLAKNEGLAGDALKTRALEIFKDAIKIKPETIEGEIARSQGIADAQYSTYTNSGNLSDLALSIRKLFNKATGDFRLGDQIMPFVKTPANVVEATLDAAGLGLAKAIYRLPNAIQEMRAGNGKPMRQVVNLAIRTGVGFSFAFALAMLFDPDDFIGEYDSMSQKDRDLAGLKGAPYNAVRIGGKWVSLDYFGPLASPFVGIMYARKYGNGATGTGKQYLKGVVGQGMRFPGARTASDVYDTVKTAAQNDFEGTGRELGGDMIGYIRSRTIPAIVSDTAKAFDNVERQTDRKDIFSKVKAGIPGLRKTLQPRIDRTTGEEVKSEGFLSTILFGSRLQNAQQNKVIEEINKLYADGVGPTISDIERVSPRVKTLQEQIGEDRFQEALKYYGRTYGEKGAKAIDSNKYKKANLEDKKKILDDARSDALESMLKKFGYKKPKN